MLMVKNIYTMEYWKSKKNNPKKDEGAICFLHFFLRLVICFLHFFSRLVVSFVCAFLGSILIARIAGEKIMYNIPIRAGTFLVRVFSPDTVIDGETAYDVHMLDEFLFLFVPLFVCFFVLFKFKK